MPRLLEKSNLTASRVNAFCCPPDKDQAFLRDAEVARFAVRATRSGAKAYIFEAKLAGETVGVTIGDPRAWTLKLARDEARRLQTIIDSGRDPRIEKAQITAKAQEARMAEQAAIARQKVIARDAWDAYCRQGETHGTSRKPWGELHLRDHKAVASQGGEPAKRGNRLTEPGPLATLLDRPLAELTSTAIEDWLMQERVTRPTRTSLAFRLLRGFLNWCGEHPTYAQLANAKAHAARNIRSKVPATNAKKDSLQSSQLKVWFTAVQKHGGAIASTYLQCLLLTGARPNELARLRWADVSFRWHTVKMRDKVAGTRTVPLTNHVKKLLKALPKSDSPWVFPSDVAKSGHIGDTSDTHNRALKAADIDYLTLHGLRRSFASLSEWLELPKGVVAQIQGHKPSATTEKHYIIREPDLLRRWHNRIERWILVKAGQSVTGAVE